MSVAVSVGRLRGFFPPRGGSGVAAAAAGRAGPRLEWVTPCSRLWGFPGLAPPLGLKQGRGQEPSGPARREGGREGAGAGGGLVASAGWRDRGGSASGSGDSASSFPVSACPRCLPDFCPHQGLRLTSLPPQTDWLGSQGLNCLGGPPVPMHFRAFRGLAGALFTLLCVGLLSLRYHSSLSLRMAQDTLRLTQPDPGPLELQLGDIFIAVKTTWAFHRSRLDLLLDTWVSRTRQQVTGGPERAPGRGAHRGLPNGLGRSCPLGGPSGVSLYCSFLHAHPHAPGAPQIHLSTSIGFSVVTLLQAPPLPPSPCGSPSFPRFLALTCLRVTGGC